MTTFCTLFSGSSGNVTYLGTDRGAILIDCGMSGSQVLHAMEEAGLNPGDLSAILVTHEHSDHIKGVGVLSRKLDLPIYATEGTWAAMENAIGSVPLHRQVTIAAGESFFLNDLEIVPFSIPHDAADPVGYRVFTPRASIAVATDLGYFAPQVEDAVSGAEIVLLESNHDPDMLRRNSHYTETLKQRILGNHGHLSNDACAEAVVQLAESGVKQIILGHLSGENNLPALALETSTRRAEREGIVLGEDLNLDIALRDTVGPVYTLQEGA